MDVTRGKRFHLNVGKIAEAGTTGLSAEKLGRLVTIRQSWCHKVIKDLAKLFLRTEDAFLQSHAIFRFSDLFNISATMPMH